MSDIRVTALERNHYGVEVVEGTVRTEHKVAVPDAFDDLALGGVDGAEIVRQAFAFLLDREPATAIFGHFPIDQIATFFPDFYDELRIRLGV